MVSHLGIYFVCTIAIYHYCWEEEHERNGRPRINRIIVALLLIISLVLFPPAWDYLFPQSKQPTNKEILQAIQGLKHDNHK